MRYYHHCAIVALYGSLENILRAHIHVVGRLVKDEQVVRLQHQSGHSQTTALTTRENLHFLINILASEQKCSQNIS